MILNQFRELYGQRLLLDIYELIPGLENLEYGRMDRLLWPRYTLYPQKLELTSPKSGGRSVGIVRSPTKATELVS
jgi:hypothetical protein